MMARLDERQAARTAIWAFGLWLAAAGATEAAAEAAPRWSGQGAHRLLVEVAPVDLGSRPRDTMPAELVIDWKSALKEAGLVGRADLGSIQVVRYDPGSGEPLGLDEGYRYARGPHDRPFAWYDDAIPYDFPQVLGAISRSGGVPRRAPRVRAGYVYNAQGSWNGGHLAWVHTQDGGGPSRYAIYFDLLPKDQEPDRPVPRGWIGDAMPRADRWGSTTTGSDHTAIACDDWNDDGLVDVIAGEHYGCLFVWPNRGTKQVPAFPYCTMMMDADGLPIDVGMHATPLVTDWDGDGVKDLVVGVYENRVVWFRNRGTNRDRKLVYEKYVRVADGGELKLPVRPVVGRPEAIFREDYHPVLERADWNGDGRLDLLAGGYITGRIYVYENTGSAADGTPVLEPRGPIEADGHPLNVGDWCASPCAADFNGDGLLDLVTGGLPMTERARAGTSLLHYYENQGTRARPVLAERPLPSKGTIPRVSMAKPRAADFNGDGLADLVVSSREDIYLFPNIGSKTEPRFDVTPGPLRSAWGSAPLPTRQFLDWNHDGWPDLVSNYQVRLNTKQGNPFAFEEKVDVLPPGMTIAHPSGVGDDWIWPYLSDFDQDGKVDVLFGDWHGTIWFHRNTGTEGAAGFDREGRRLTTRDGQPLKVGPIQADPGNDFIALQGARTVFTVADFDGDGRLDLVVGDTFGKVRYFHNSGTRAEPVFDPGVDVGDVKIRTLVDSTDWNGDGKIDVIAGAANGIVRVYLNVGKTSAARFDEGHDPGLPPILQPGAIMVDLNRDGDDDLFLTSTQGSVLVERSFLKHGYAQGRLRALESRGTPPARAALPPPAR